MYVADTLSRSLPSGLLTSSETEDEIEAVVANDKAS